MDKAEARHLLANFMAELQKKPYRQLLELVGEPVCVEVEGRHGKKYQIEYESFWDAESGGPLRVIASIDDGGLLSALSPVTMDFLVDTSGNVLE